MWEPHYQDAILIVYNVRVYDQLRLKALTYPVTMTLGVEWRMFLFCILILIRKPPTKQLVIHAVGGSFRFVITSSLLIDLELQ